LPSGLTFALYTLRFSFEALGEIAFPPGGAANVWRGAFGLAFRRIASVGAYTRLFEPGAMGPGPSGFADWPRPFVFRARHLDGRTLAAGERFPVGVNLFDTGTQARESIQGFIDAFVALGNEGVGPRRAPMALIEAAAELVTLSLEPDADAPTRIRIEFLTPTELKRAGIVDDRPEFAVVFARVRDRVTTLRALYGAGPLEIDFAGMAERASLIRLERCDLHHVAVERRSSRTGQTHPIGGFVGEAEYSGELGEFLPWLKAAEWTGVGRQTVWGKGEIHITGIYS
jgi:hypothetical protein